MKRQRMAFGAGALVVCLALSTGGCSSGGAGGSSSDLSSVELYDEYDEDNDNDLSREEWGQAYDRMDANGDGMVTGDEFSDAVRGGGGGRR